jgi:hypothetical protein
MNLLSVVFYSFYPYTVVVRVTVYGTEVVDRSGMNRRRGVSKMFTSETVEQQEKKISLKMDYAAQLQEQVLTI